MKTIKIDTWEEFEIKVEELYREHKSKKENSDSYHSDLLFRGHGNSDWKLQTTLERYKNKDTFNLRSYDQLLRSINPFINTAWNKKFDVKMLDDEKYSSRSLYTHELSLNNIEIKTLLRHYGFPSPLLDWTKSPYVAAWFAFNTPSSKEVAIFAYKEWLGYGKSSSSSEPKIQSVGPYIETDPRHFNQQSQYTLCLQQLETKNKYVTKNEYHYVSHEEFFKIDQTYQDMLYKFILPVSVRIQVLEKLNLMNITASSLFQTKESFLDTLALRELTLSNQWDE